MFRRGFSSISPLLSGGRKHFSSSVAKTHVLNLDSSDAVLKLVNDRHRASLSRGSVVNIIKAVHQQLSGVNELNGTPYMDILKKAHSVCTDSTPTPALTNHLMDFMDAVPIEVVARFPSLRMLFETNHMAKTQMYHDVISDHIAEVTREQFPIAAQRSFTDEYIFEGMTAQARAYCETGDLREFSQAGTMRQVGRGFTLQLLQPSFTRELEYICDEVNGWASQQRVVFKNGQGVFDDSGEPGIMTEQLCRLGNFGLQRPLAKVMAPLMDDLTAKLHPQALYADLVAESLRTHAKVALPQDFFASEADHHRAAYIEYLAAAERGEAQSMPAMMFEGATSAEDDKLGKGDRLRFTIDEPTDRLLYVSEKEQRLKAVEEKLLSGVDAEAAQKEDKQLFVGIPQQTLAQLTFPLSVDSMRMASAHSATSQAQADSEESKGVLIDVPRGWAFFSMRGEAPAALLDQRAHDYKFLIVGGASSALRQFMEAAHAYQEVQGANQQ